MNPVKLLLKFKFISEFKYILNSRCAHSNDFFLCVKIVDKKIKRSAEFEIESKETERYKLMERNDHFRCGRMNDEKGDKNKTKIWNPKSLEKTQLAPGIERSLYEIREAKEIRWIRET